MDTDKDFFDEELALFMDTDKDFFDEELALFMDTDKDFFDEELALSELLENDILFCNNRYYSSTKDGKSEGNTTVLFVNCNDAFGWACADAEDLPYGELKNLYNSYLKDKLWGSTIWCCIKRNEKPLTEIINIMKKENLWNDILEKLPDNIYETALKRKLKESKLTS